MRKKINYLFILLISILAMNISSFNNSIKMNEAKAYIQQGRMICYSAANLSELYAGYYFTYCGDCSAHRGLGIGPNGKCRSKRKANID